VLLWLVSLSMFLRRRFSAMVAAFSAAGLAWLLLVLRLLKRALTSPCLRHPQEFLFGQAF
jgi:hypothetical protein